MEALLTHTCTLRTRCRKQRLDYDQGTRAFIVGDKVTGAVSGATATIDTLVLSSGSWTGGDAKGYLVLSDVVGTFQDEEAITSTTSGAAVADGANVDYVTGGGEYLYYDKTMTTNCRFATPAPRLVVGDVGEYVRRPTRLYLPPATIREGDSVETSVVGYAGRYRVRGVYHVYGYNGVHHLECDVEALP